MRYLILIFSCLLIFSSCTNDTNSGESDCPECQSWEVCDPVLEICRPADGYCSSDQHCLDPQNSACNLETHLCVPDLCLINPCVQYQGSNRGQCELDDSEEGYRCICDSGYIEQDGLCVADENSPCFPNPCDQTNQTSCSVVDEKAVCSCDTGYILEDDHCVVSDLCDPNPCTELHETVCETLGGNPVCLCDNGFVRDDTGNCVETDLCHPNPCDDLLMICIVTEGAFECQCPLGYINQDDHCVVDVQGPCDGVTCDDPNAICVVEGDVGVCACKVGYQKDSSGLCVATCSDQCAQEGSSCIEGSLDQKGICYYNEATGCLEQSVVSCPDGTRCEQSDSGASCVDDGCEEPCDPDNFPMCEDGKIVMCERFEGCYTKDTEPCDDGEICQGSAGAAFCGALCENSCNPANYPVCGSYNTMLYCEKDDTSCYKERSELCANNQKCRYTPEGATCDPPECTDSCNPGAYPKCSDDVTQVLVCDDFNGDNCYEEQVAATCSNGKICKVTAQSAGCDYNCTDQCDPVAQRYNWCSDDQRDVMTCEKQANGCYRIITWENCSYSEICIEQSDGAICSNGCEELCDPTQLSSCNSSQTAIVSCSDLDNDGCFEPVTTQCGSDKICTIGSAGAVCVNNCTNECSPSSYPKCSSDQTAVERCIDINNDGCYELTTTNCGSGTVCQPESMSCVNISCIDGIDDDNDGWIDSEDPDCLNGFSEQGFGTTACNDGTDNDRDKMIDRNDPGCDSALDDDEDNHIEPDNCNNGIDDDNDGWIDIFDPDCALGDTENGYGYTQCNDGIDNDGDGAIDGDDTKCSFAYQIQEGEASVDNCSDGIDNDGDGWSDIQDPDCLPLIGAGGEIGYGSTECNDGIDNDGDGKTDKDDSNCFTAIQTSEGAANTNCSDGIDNDNDGWSDEQDPDCIPFLGSGNESGYGTTECNDGIDNDNDLFGFLKDNLDPQCIAFGLLTGGYGALGKEGSVGPDIDLSDIGISFP